MCPAHLSATLQARLEQETGAIFNSCLLNLYRNGRDHMSYHSDNEALYGAQPVIGKILFSMRAPSTSVSCSFNYGLSGGQDQCCGIIYTAAARRHNCLRAGSVSFGEARPFILRQNSIHARKLTFALGNGDMLTMQVSGHRFGHWTFGQQSCCKCASAKSLGAHHVACLGITSL